MHEIWSWIFWYPLAPITYPVVCILYTTGFLRPPSAWRPEGPAELLTHYADYPTEPLPSPRPRRLTLPLRPWRMGDISIRQKTQGQAQSMLFSKLPVEIRMLIYDLALSGDGRTIHIVRRRRDHLSHVRCTNQDGRCKGYECFRWWTPSSLHRSGSDNGTINKTHGGLLPLLSSCRRMYVYRYQHQQRIH